MLDPIYATDEYPREACTVSIDVQKDGYHMSVFAPNGKHLEGYALVKTPRAVSRMLEEWACGYAPRINSRLDHSPDKS
jgi:hypothetical protein